MYKFIFMNIFQRSDDKLIVQVPYGPLFLENERMFMKRIDKQVKTMIDEEDVKTIIQLALSQNISCTECQFSQPNMQGRKPLGLGIENSLDEIIAQSQALKIIPTVLTSQYPYFYNKQQSAFYYTISLINYDQGCVQPKQSAESAIINIIVNSVTIKLSTIRFQAQISRLLSLSYLTRVIF
ncbi:Hypothetical_protein [Hexamita inflata]|uniref:Hypothetical_protein n=1 Tax=Hexamita inflata TaxID=28002 RepID=A0AA86P7C4_9EUKA|nr:Hypothetical protein HINF_LOCUS20811 [Hexamita inflata]